MSADLRRHLVDTRIAGDVTTSRENNLRNAERMAQGRPGYDFGLVPSRPWSRDEVLEVMVRRCGVQPDPAYERAPDTIDPDLTLAALDRVRDRLALAAQRRERVLLATGHPTGILVLHLAVAAALRAAGAQVLVPTLDWSWPWDREGDWSASRPRHVRAIGGVHVLASGGELREMDGSHAHHGPTAGGVMHGGFSSTSRRDSTRVPPAPPGLNANRNSRSYDEHTVPSQCCIARARSSISGSAASSRPTRPTTCSVCGSPSPSRSSSEEAS